MRFRVIRRVAWERIAAALTAVVLAVALDGTDAIVTLGAVLLVLVLSIVVETARLHDFRAALRAGAGGGVGQGQARTSIRRSS